MHMKKLLFTASFVLALLAQPTLEASDDTITYTCEDIEVKSDSLIVLNGHVDFLTKQIQVKDADQVTYNQKNGLVQVYGYSEISFTACEVQSNFKKGTPKNARFTLGSGVIQLD
jgi:lipopolysaccharide assembly outer membrane protein LptD (OstA)